MSSVEQCTFFESLLDRQLRADPRVDEIARGGVRLAKLAVSRGNVEIVDLVLARGASHLHEPSFEDHTLLAAASLHGHIEVAKLLIERGADLHLTGTDGLTPLAWAIEKGRGEMVELLSLAGAVR